MSTPRFARRVVRLKIVARSLIPLAAVVAAFALVPLSASAAPASFGLVFDGHHVVAPQFTGGLAHVGTFTTNDALCPSGHAEDIAVRRAKGSDHFDSTRLFTCDGSSGATFTATIHLMNAECQGYSGVWQVISGTGPLADLRGKGSFTSVVTGGDPQDTLTITFRTTWTGTADLDAMPPTLALTKHTITKLSRPSQRYRLKLTLALSDNGGGPVAYSLTLVDPSTLKALVRKSGTTSAASIHWTLVLKPRARTRALRLNVVASDAVGNQSTLRRKIPLKK
ncbi:MAG: hypothetical protein ACXVRE_08850 [Gaiellaceae bacterium]